MPTSKSRDWEKTILWIALAVTLYANQDRTGAMAIVGPLIVAALIAKLGSIFSEK